MFLKVNTTWFNLDTITRVEVTTHSAPTRTQLAVSLTDKQAPVDVTEPRDVEKVLAFMERHNADAKPEPAKSAK